MAGNNYMHAKCANTGTAELRAFLAHVQELDDQALEVMKAAKATEALLAERAEQLAAIRAEFERKQKEVRPVCSLLRCPSSPLPTDDAVHTASVITCQCTHLLSIHVVGR